MKDRRTTLGEMAGTTSVELAELYEAFDVPRKNTFLGINWRYLIEPILEFRSIFPVVLSFRLSELKSSFARRLSELKSSFARLVPAFMSSHQADIDIHLKPVHTGNHRSILSALNGENISQMLHQTVKPGQIHDLPLKQDDQPEVSQNISDDNESVSQRYLSISP